MFEVKLGIVESKFADIVWENEPLSSRRLTELCEEKLNWKRTTTFTVLKKLCSKGLFENVKGTVSALVSREDFYAQQSKEYVEETYNGSLPSFIAAFTRKQELTEDEIKEIQNLIDSLGKDK